MNDDGFFVIDRGLFSHSFFADEPYSEREAWIWLIGAAAWKETRIRTSHGMVTIGRGQMMHSERFLATKWKWSKSRVNRFLFRLESEAMLNRQTDQETGRITICNYDEYQLGRTSDRTRDKSETGPASDQPRTKEEELKNLRKNNIDGGADAPADNVVPIQRQYEFEGRTIKLTKVDLDRWRSRYSAIIDIAATLQAADDYYSDNPPKDGKWFFPVSRWLDKEHKTTLERMAISAKEHLRMRGEAW
jgi:hypothetical protein